MKTPIASIRGALHRWRQELPVYAVAAAMLAICGGLLAGKGVPFDVRPLLANAQLFGYSIMAMLAGIATHELVIRRPLHPMGHLRETVSYNCPQMIAGLPLLALLVLLMPFFSMMKAAIPLFADYDWDASFIAWDRAIFAGHDAWEVLQPLVGYPIVTALLGLLYQAWFLLLFIGTLWFAFASNAAMIRRRFFLTYVLCWTVVGGALATWLASVGPCFAGPLLDNHTFAGQMEYLHKANEQIPVMPLKVQQLLLDWHMTDANGLGSGITAMPSMHVAISLLFWLAVRRVSPSWGKAFFAFLVLIWIGSIHLAYHYAVDGLVSIIAVILLWKFSDALLSSWDAWLERHNHAAFRTNTVPAE